MKGSLVVGSEGRKSRRRNCPVDNNVGNLKTVGLDLPGVDLGRTSLAEVVSQPRNGRSSRFVRLTIVLPIDPLINNTCNISSFSLMTLTNV